MRRSSVAFQSIGISAGIFLTWSAVLGPSTLAQAQVARPPATNPAAYVVDTDQLTKGATVPPVASTTPSGAATNSVVTTAAPTPDSPVTSAPKLKKKASTTVEARILEPTTVLPAPSSSTPASTKAPRTTKAPKPLVVADTVVDSNGSASESNGGIPASTWAALRQCESKGNYKINTGNGFYGAYQFSATTWRALGFSGLPHEAAAAVQDEAARKLQARAGWGQWPACSRKLGLR